MFAHCKVIYILIVSFMQINWIIEILQSIYFSIIYCMFVFELCIVYIITKLQKLLRFRLSLILHEMCLIWFQFRLYLLFITNTYFLEDCIITFQVVA